MPRSPSRCGRSATVTGSRADSGPLEPESRSVTLRGSPTEDQTRTRPACGTHCRGPPGTAAALLKVKKEAMEKQISWGCKLI